MCINLLKFFFTEAANCNYRNQSYYITSCKIVSEVILLRVLNTTQNPRLYENLKTISFYENFLVEISSNNVLFILENINYCWRGLTDLNGLKHKRLRSDIENVFESHYIKNRSSDSNGNYLSFFEHRPKDKCEEYQIAI